MKYWFINYEKISYGHPDKFNTVTNIHPFKYINGLKNCSSIKNRWGYLLISFQEITEGDYIYYIKNINNG